MALGDLQSAQVVRGSTGLAVSVQPAPLSRTQPVGPLETSGEEAGVGEAAAVGNGSDRLPSPSPRDQFCLRRGQPLSDHQRLQAQVVTLAQLVEVAKRDVVRRSDVVQLGRARTGVGARSRESAASVRLPEPPGPSHRVRLDDQVKQDGGYQGLTCGNPARRLEW